MSWSLRLHNGDFALSGSKFDTVTDFDKLTQDLRCAILEKMGTDDMHPDYGSLIDGGITTDGVQNPGAIGLLGEDSAQLVQSEIQRIAANYQNQQLARAKDDRITYNRVSLTPNEVLLSISNLSLQQSTNVLDVHLTLATAAGQDVSVAFQLTPSS